MNGLRKLSLMAAMLVCTTLAAVAQKPNIHILATGGTIAGTGASATKTNYTAGQVAISTSVSYTHLTLPTNREV